MARPSESASESSETLERAAPGGAPRPASGGRRRPRLLPARLLSLISALLATTLAASSISTSVRAGDRATVQVIHTGDLAVARFSGTSPSKTTETSESSEATEGDAEAGSQPAPAPADSRGATAFIDLDGASVRIYHEPADHGRGGGDAPLTLAPPFEVTARQIGQVFGLAFDDGRRQGAGAPIPNLYAAATSRYGVRIVVPDRDGDGRPEVASKGGPGARFMPGQWGAELGGGPGAIWKIDGRTGAVSLFAEVTLDGVPNSGPGLGQIAFDGAHRQLFVSDLDTGMIHRFDLAGNDLGHFDHGVRGRPQIGLPPVPHDPQRRMEITSPAFSSADPATWGLAAPERLIEGLAVRDGRLYYTTRKPLKVWSVGIRDDGSFADDVRAELDILSLDVASGNDRAGRLRSPIIDIAFDADGTLLIAEEVAEAVAAADAARGNSGAGEAVQHGGGEAAQHRGGEAAQHRGGDAALRGALESAQQSGRPKPGRLRKRIRRKRILRYRRGRPSDAQAPGPWTALPAAHVRDLAQNRRRALALGDPLGLGESGAGRAVLGVSLRCEAGIAGRPIPCRIAVSNSGMAAPAGPVRVEAALAAGLDAAGGGPGGVIAGLTPDGTDWECRAASPKWVTCVVPGSALGPGVVRTFDIALAALGGGRLSSCAKATYRRRANDEALAQTPETCAEGGIDIVVSQTGDETCAPGQLCTLQVQLSNRGGDDFVGPVALTDALLGGAQAEIVAITPPLGCATMPRGLPFSCRAQLRLPAGARRTHSIRLRLPQTASARTSSKGATLTNCVSLTDPGGLVAADGTATPPDESGPGTPGIVACHTFRVAAKPPACVGGMVRNRSGLCACPGRTRWDGRRCFAGDGGRPVSTRPKTPPGPTAPPDGRPTPPLIGPTCPPDRLAFRRRADVPAGWLRMRRTRNGITIWCAKPRRPSRGPRCRKGWYPFKARAAIPEGWRRYRARRNGRVIWCAKPRSIAPRCPRGWRRIARPADAPKGWPVMVVDGIGAAGQRFAIYCTRPTQRRCPKTRRKSNGGCCPKGTKADGNQCFPDRTTPPPSTCPKARRKSNGGCCPKGTKADGNQCFPDRTTPPPSTCPKARRKSNGGCCPKGTKADGNQCFPDRTTPPPTACPKPRRKSNGGCCPKGTKADGNQCFRDLVVPPPVQCPKARLKRNGGCCPLGMRAQGNRCVPRVITPPARDCPKLRRKRNGRCCPKGTRARGNRCLPRLIDTRPVLCPRAQRKKNGGCCPKGTRARGNRCIFVGIERKPRPACPKARRKRNGGCCPPGRVALGNRCVALDLKRKKRDGKSRDGKQRTIRLPRGLELQLKKQ